jgi:3-hydroxyacyl-[acyl-carrier-protein] dehydratase
VLDPLLLRLPHRPPFLLLDRVLAFEPGAWVAAVKEIDAADPFLDPAGEWPAVLLVEVMAQAAGLAASGSRDDGAAVVASIDRCRCRASVRAGDTLLAFARVRRIFGPTALVRVALRRGSRPWAAAEIALRFG